MIKQTVKRLTIFVSILSFIFLTLFGHVLALSSEQSTPQVTPREERKGFFVSAQVFSSEAVTVKPTKASAESETTSQNQKTLPTELICGGELFGVRMETNGLLITALGTVETEGGELSPGENAGLKPGDVLTHADGVALKCAADLVKLISRSEGKSITLKRVRQGEAKETTLHPALSADGGGYKAGLWVRDGAAGIGTVTFQDPKSGAFAGLGHAVCDSQSGTAFPLKSGTVCHAEAEGIRKGGNGSPGELRGRLDKTAIGTVTANTKTGIYGTLPLPENSTTVPVGLKNEVKTGKATLLCTLDHSGKKEYEIEIEEIIDKDRDCKNLILHVTDPDLLAQTGGIIQGMSGSPILQDGKLVGAVTHVLVSDPTRGYGIFIENMLDAAS